jgi:hypothetical protein
MTSDGIRSTPHRATVTDPPPEDWRRAVVSGPTGVPGVTPSWQDAAHAAEERAARAEGRVEALERALARRPAIEQAKGVLMATFGLSAESAVDALTWTSRRGDLTLAAVAERFVGALGAVGLDPATRDEVTRALAGTIATTSA